MLRLWCALVFLLIVPYVVLMASERHLLALRLDRYLTNLVW